MKIRTCQDNLNQKYAMIDSLIKEGALDQEANCGECGAGPMERGLGFGGECPMAEGKKDHVPGHGDEVIIKLKGNPEIVDEILKDIMDKAGVSEEDFEKMMNKKDNVEDMENLFGDKKEKEEEHHKDGKKKEGSLEVKKVVKEARELTVGEQHQKRIAIQTLKMNDVMAGVMGGMSKKEARNFLTTLGWSDEKIARLENE